LNEALQQFTEAVANRPDDRIAHFHMGRILANQARYVEAIEHFLKTLIPEDDKTPRYLYALGATYARAGDLPDALKYTRAARAQAAARDQAELLISIDRDLRTLEQAAPNINKQ
jgi:tetratricopeptide (TPR) repeat protein